MLRQTLSFSLHDEVEGRTLTPENVDLLTLHQTDATEAQLEGAD